jgi:two-component system, LytTR family, response regulator
MSKLRLLIVDDEPLIRKGLRDALSAFSDIEVVEECGSGEEAIRAISAKHPDLVLLDVRMPDRSGLDVVREVGPSQMPPVIFITAYDSYAVDAFELNAVDYLLKPFEQERLQKSIERARRRMSEGSQASLSGRLEALLRDQNHNWAARLVVRNGERYEFVASERIDWIESANNYVRLHCGVKQHLLGETLTSLAARLDPSKFVRVHRGRMVNIERIVAVHPLFSGTYEMELTGGVRITTGRQYKDAVQKLIQR